ncbi:hypothetical protein Poli38472_005086 [Pythium oligandrum]|uniref:PX domain-containing protein n=1 Tax=Pythium oligandrum TaxID=41045 RepID=A0A8K1CHA5_PYTOL|nr:hypothetical protein Poli38472_005086 [Pythium oligandrum]|eukprot:TMW62468.1 hypothetical protein Poli38472_005086 [Pythium oligandrum]
MQMLNVSALITGYETVGDHTEFIVQISCNGGLWLISRRFSDFDQLHSRLLRSFGDLIETHLPEKQWFGRFDPNFLVKRQSGLQEYLASLLLVPGILEDRSLLHFLELEKHLELDGGLMIGAGRTSTGGLTSKSILLSENDRLSAIVETAAQTFIDVSEVPEPLEAEQAAQRKNEIVQVSQSALTDQKVLESFRVAIKLNQLPQPPVARYTVDAVIARLEAGPEDGLTLEQEQDLLLSALNRVEASLRLEIAPPSTELIALMDGAAAIYANGRISDGFGEDMGNSSLSTSFS